jgi:triacylglycerol lipase
LDLLLEEDLEYARRLARAGVPVELHVYPGGLHGFELVADSHLAKEVLRTSLTALKRALHGAT